MQGRGNEGAGTEADGGGPLVSPEMARHVLKCQQQQLPFQGTNLQAACDITLALLVASPIWAGVADGSGACRVLLLAVSLGASSLPSSGVCSLAKLLLQFTTQSSDSSVSTVAAACWSQCAPTLAAADAGPGHPHSTLIAALQAVPKQQQWAALEALVDPLLACWLLLNTRLQDEALWVLVQSLTSRRLGVESFVIDVLRSIAHMVCTAPLAGDQAADTLCCSLVLLGRYSCPEHPHCPRNTWRPTSLCAEGTRTLSAVAAQTPASTENASRTQCMMTLQTCVTS